MRDGKNCQNRSTWGFGQKEVLSLKYFFLPVGNQKHFANFHKMEGYPHSEYERVRRRVLKLAL